MATAESVKAQLESLLAQANSTTGNQDSTLTAAVAALVAGFGQGGEVTVKSLTVTPTEVVDTVIIPELIGKQNVIFIPRFSPAAEMTSSGGIIGTSLFLGGSHYFSTRTNTGNSGWSGLTVNAPYGSTTGGTYFKFNPATGEIGGVGSSSGSMVAQPYEIFYW